jgi:hypothetical protein
MIQQSESDNQIREVSDGVVHVLRVSATQGAQSEHQAC